MVRPASWVDDRTVQTFHQPADAILVDAVRAEITALPTYGYRRAGALVNRTRALMGLQAINHKRFYRVMKENRLLLPKAPKRPVSNRVHDGVVAVVNSDLKLIQFWRSQRFKTDTPPSPAHAGFSLFSSLVQSDLPALMPLTVPA